MVINLNISIIFILIKYFTSNFFSSSFSNFDVLTAQVLLTHDDMNNADRYLNAKAAIEKILKLNVIPIINEKGVICLIISVIHTNTNAVQTMPKIRR